MASRASGLLILVLLGLFGAIASARGAEAPASQAAEPVSTLSTIVVSGEQPGPGLWKISKDDHVLWILGTLSPLPKKMDWVARDIDARIAESQQVILLPSVRFDIKGGMLRGLFLLPSLLGARNNPDKAKLADVVPPELYARWEILKARYIGRDNGVEKRRPIFAAQELFTEAIKDAGLSLDDVVGKAVEKSAKRHKVERIEPRIEVRIEEPGAAVREFKRSPLDDIDCFARTLDRLETDLESMKLRANAWALGDIEMLQSLTYTDQFQACADAVLKASVAEENGFGDLRERLATTWFEAADGALTRNRSTFALLPLRFLLGEKSPLARFRARGYQVEAPE